MKAIETRYKGYRFRSRLEARWAVFFDAMGVRWEYEPQGFVVGGECYLPDFRIPAHLGMIVTDDGLAERMSMHPGEMVGLERWEKHAWGQHVSILLMPTAGDMWFEVKPNADISDDENRKLSAFIKECSAGLLVAKGDPVDMDLIWLGPDSAGPAALAGTSDNGTVLSFLVGGAGCYPDLFYKVAGEFRRMYLDAANSARSARFEHGETPGAPWKRRT